jgi:hypothetical protein
VREGRKCPFPVTELILRPSNGLHNEDFRVTTDAVGGINGRRVKCARRACRYRTRGGLWSPARRADTYGQRW